MNTLATTLIDADACPVKEEAVHVAGWHGLTIHFVSNAPSLDNHRTRAMLRP